VGGLLYDGAQPPAQEEQGNQGNTFDAQACEVIPARVGRRQVLHLLDRMLNRARREITAASATEQPRPPSGETRIALLLARAQTAIKRRSVVFVVSDFISVPGWEKAIALLARRHEVLAVRLYDPMELELPDLGFVVMQDAETGEQLFVDTRDRRFRQRFAEAATRREVRLRGALAEAGIDCLELATDDNVGAALLRFIQLRKRRSQLAEGAITARPPISV